MNLKSLIELQRWCSFYLFHSDLLVDRWEHSISHIDHPWMLMYMYKNNGKWFYSLFEFHYSDSWSMHKNQMEFHIESLDEREREMMGHAGSNQYCVPVNPQGHWHCRTFLSAEQLPPLKQVSSMHNGTRQSIPRRRSGISIERQFVKIHRWILLGRHKQTVHYQRWNKCHRSDLEENVSRVLSVRFLYCITYIDLSGKHRSSFRN